MSTLERIVNIGDSYDAEVQAIIGIPQLLEDLTNERKVGILNYLIERIKSGDNFGK